MAPDIHAAPAGTHLSAQRLAHLESLLLADLGAQTGRMEECRVAIGELTDQASADAAFEREVAEIGLAQADAAAREVRHALGRLELGTYGSCEGCGGTIPLERLEAVPQARRCVSCPTQRTGLLG
jgi:DnaK suppressor protein